MNPSSASGDAAQPADTHAIRRVIEIAAPAGMATALADFLFWGVRPGLNVGLFFAGLAVLLLTRHRGKPARATWLILALIAATCVQSAIELSFSNVLSALALTVALAGQVFQPQLRGWWARISEVLHGMVAPFRRWADLAAGTSRAITAAREANTNFGGSATFALQVVLPAVLLLGIFTAFFATGNAVFGNMLERTNDAFFRFWQSLDITPLRLIWWGFLVTVMLCLFHGTRAPEAPRWWTREIPRVPRENHRLAVWQTAVALVAINILFCVVNTLDAIFVWGQAALPEGVTFSAFVHAGVNSLLGAVVLSAVVIAGMFQQDDATASHRWLKVLARVWVAQNLLLISGVLRRLMLYTEAYHLTERRVYVACFLALVAVGFLLLDRFVRKRRSFNWLLGTNIVAVLALFFILQFANVAGAVAKTNVERWKANADIDVAYLAELGPAAWPQLIEVAKSTRNPFAAALAREELRVAASMPRAEDWRSFQARESDAHDKVADFITTQN